MKLFAKKTLLSTVPGLSDSDIQYLKSCWIDTWEEYCAYAKTYSNYRFAGSDFFANKIDNNIYNGILTAEVAPRQLGCIISEARLKQMASAYCGSVASDGKPKSIGYDLKDESDLPHEVRMMSHMPPIGEQGARGTCTAFAAIALSEFAEKCQCELSPQFLYWSCKERDGNPHADGTTLDTVQEALYEDGVCEERLWPYCQNNLLDDNDVLNAGQGPAPAGAVEDAKRHRLSCRALSPNAVMQYRRILASGKPVVVGIVAFNSWLANRSTEETGRVPMPYMIMGADGAWHLLEEPQGGHAMCLVGYVDDDSVPGGGYFIVRNSWGEDWAKECNEGAGHALIPYRYMALFTYSAFTMIDQPSVQKNGEKVVEDESNGQDASPSVLDELPLNLRPFARVLESETRDFRGALLPKGTCVLSLPRPGSSIVEYKQENFGTKEYREILVLSRFPDKLRWTEEQSSIYDSVSKRKQEFCAKIDENLTESNLRFKPFPEFKFSWNLLQWMGESRIWSSSIIKEMDFSDRLFDALVADMLPADEMESEQIPEDWRKMMKETVVARIRKVTSFALLPDTVYIVEVFATPFEIDAKTGVCRFACPSVRLVDIVRQCAATAMANRKKGKYIFYTIGTGLPLDNGTTGVREGASSVIVSGPADGGSWDVRSPGYLTGQSAYRDFSDRLMPVTREDVVSAVKTYVDSVAGDSMKSGRVFVNEIVEHLHDKTFNGMPALRQTRVIRALLQMQGNDPGKYAVCMDVHGAQEVFVVPSTEVIEGKDKPYKGRGWLANLLLFHSIHFLGLMICSALFIGKAELEMMMGWNKSFVLKVVLAAATMCVSGFIQSKFNHLVSSIEKD